MNALLCRSLTASAPPSSETSPSLGLQAAFRHLPCSSLRRTRSNQTFFSSSPSLLTVAPRLGRVMNVTRSDYDSGSAQSSSSPSKGAYQLSPFIVRSHKFWFNLCHFLHYFDSMYHTLYYLDRFHHFFNWLIPCPILVLL